MKFKIEKLGRNDKDTSAMKNECYVKIKNGKLLKNCVRLVHSRFISKEILKILYSLSFFFNSFLIANECIYKKVEIYIKNVRKINKTYFCSPNSFCKCDSYL